MAIEQEKRVLVDPELIVSGSRAINKAEEGRRRRVVRQLAAVGKFAGSGVIGEVTTWSGTKVSKAVPMAGRRQGEEGTGSSLLEESDSESEMEIGSGRGGRPAPLCGASERRMLRANRETHHLSSLLLKAILR